MLDLDTLRAEFAKKLSEGTNPASFDAAFVHVVTLAYNRGAKDITNDPEEGNDNG